MKRLTLGLLSACFFGLCGPVSAQTADTTSAWRYLPLHEGNVWEYVRWVEECITWDLCTEELTGYERWTVTSDSVAAGILYKKLRVESFDTDAAPVGSTVHLVRFDSSAAKGYRRLGGGKEIYWPGGITCSLDAPFESEIACGEGWGGVFVDPFEAPVRVGDEEEIRLGKYFSGLISWTSFIADVGLSSDGAAEFGGSGMDLTYARTGQVEYGDEQFPVANESTPVPSTLALASYPNPTRDIATLALTLDRPQRATVAVYDMLGRRVLSEDLGALSAGERTHRLNLAALSPGVYVVRMTGSAGATATTRLIIQ